MSRLVSVIMSVYNESEKWLCESIDSILNQTYNNLEFIIVIDNPNNENIKKVIDAYKKNDKRVKIIINEKNLGLVDSLNIAIKYCNGYYIARMDADDISFKNRIEKQKNYLEKNDFDFVMSHIDKIDENGEIINISHIMEDYDTKKLEKLERYCNVSTHPTWFMKRKVYDELKGYRNISRCEDYDFILRAFQRGFSISKMKESLLFYRVRKNSITQENVLEQYYNSKVIRNFYCSNIDLSTVPINTIEGLYRGLTCQDIELFYKDYNLFKEKKILYCLKAIIRDSLFRMYFNDNIKMKIMKWIYTRR